MRNFFKQFDSFTNLGEGYHYLVQMGTFQNHSVFSRQHSISMQEVPFIKDPFRIEGSTFYFLTNFCHFIHCNRNTLSAGDQAAQFFFISRNVTSEFLLVFFRFGGI